MKFTEIITPGEAARRAGVSKTRLIQLADAGRLPVVVTLLGRLFDAESIDLYARERAVRQADRTVTK